MQQPCKQTHPDTTEHQHDEKPQAYIARQPIYNLDLNIFGYELLYRSNMKNSARIEDENTATTQVIMNAFTELGLDSLVGHHHAFINMTRDFLVGDIPIPFSTDRMVLEVLEDIEVNPELLAALKSLSTQGYTIALDDFVLTDANRPLLELANIVKVDILHQDMKDIEKHIQIYKQHNLKLLAEKVESQEQYQTCVDMGFELFQGYFFCKPNIIAGAQIPTNRLNTLMLLAKLQNIDTKIEELDQIINHDVSMSYRLLRLINSAFYALPKKIESIHQAMVYLGNNTLKRWATLITLSNVDDKPRLLYLTSMIRAKMCELLCDSGNQNDRDMFFTTGLFSALDALVDMTMEDLLTNLPLADDIVEALLFKQGPIGEALKCTLAYESSDWETVDNSRFEQDVIQNAYLESINWAEHTLNTISH